MRAGVHLGLISILQDRRFGLAPLGELLRSDVSGPLRASAIMFTAPGHWLPWGRLVEAVRRGRRQTVSALGRELFDYYSANPDEGDLFTGAMANFSEIIANDLVRVLDTLAVKHVVDIGGASGKIVSALLESNPALSGSIFERADVAPRAEAALAKRGLSSRCRVIAGDFFESVPEADLYVLKSIVHDWDDQQSIEILRNCARALLPNGRVVLVERIMPEQGNSGAASLFDLNMLVMLPGRERSESQFAELFRAAGLRLDRILEVGSDMRAIEVSRHA
jgi:SAM-dependent methyltransferase